jgi:hypothetical protein
MLLALSVGADNWARGRLDAAHPTIAEVPGGPADLIELLRGRTGGDRVFVQTWGIGTHELMKKLGMMHGLFAVPDYETNMPAVYERFLTGAQTRTWHGDLSLAPLLGRKPAIPNPRALDLMSVRFYASLRGPHEARLAWAISRYAPKRRTLREKWFLHERPSAVRRAYVVEDVAYVPDVDAALERIFAPEFDPLHQAVAVADAPSAFVAAPSATGRLGQARIIEQGPNDVTLHAECARRCLLVLTDLHYPGWRADVDGNEVEIVRANGIFRGVWLEPGSHRVTYRFRPWSLSLGLWLAAAGVGASAVVLLLLGPARGRARSQAAHAAQAPA